MVDIRTNFTLFYKNYFLKFKIEVVSKLLGLEISGEKYPIAGVVNTFGVCILRIVEN